MHPSPFSALDQSRTVNKTPQILYVSEQALFPSKSHKLISEDPENCSQENHTEINSVFQEKYSAHHQVYPYRPKNTSGDKKNKL